MLRRLTTLSLTLLLAGLVAVFTPGTAHAAPTDADLALRWAPVHYQDTDSSDYDADYLSKIDFDGEWDAGNNWNTQDDVLSRLTGRSYYSVVETSTHWFVLYSFYHPRDWEEICSDANCHENDMEGALMVVRKDGSTYGKLEAMVTVAHTNFYSYVPAGSTFTSGRETIDGTIPMKTWNGAAHPTTRQEAKGHGLYAWNNTGFPGGDGVVYYPSATAAEVPSGGNDSSVAYGLTDTFATGGLWAHRNDGLTFSGWGSFRGNDYKDNAANSAWGWDDGDDGGDLPRGLLATNPAYLVNEYFNGTGTFSLTYTRNGYTA